MKDFIDLKYAPAKDDVVVQYRIAPAKGYSLRKAASLVAGESSIGTWTEVSTMSDRIFKMRPRVFEISSKNKRVRIAYPIELFELGNIPNILSSIGGNIFGMKAVNGLLWEDVEFPKKMLESFRGPKFGVGGIRKMLKVKTRPLVGTIVKPKVGLQPGEHASVAYEAWVGGCDIVKDDENLTSQKFSDFRERFLKTIRMMKKAEKETGERKIYFPNCTAETKAMLRRIDFVQNNGGNYIMLDILTLGWGALQTARNFTKLPIHAHRAGHAMFDRNPNHGMSMLVIAKLARMLGVDSIHIGTVFGKMVGGKDEVLQIEEEIETPFTQEDKKNLEQNWGKIKPVMAVASGGVYPRLVPKIMKIMGNNIVIQAGGGIHGHPGGTRAGATAMRQAVDATLHGYSLKQVAEIQPELKEALRKW